MSNYPSKQYTEIHLDCRGKTITLGTTTQIMGILNVTPDSFSDGGQFNDITSAVTQALAMEDEGADIIDVGGESTRPGSQSITPQEEIARVVPIIQALLPRLKCPISIDTSKAEVANAALEAGASLVNDVWGLQSDPQLAQVAAKYDVPIVLMHNRLNHDYPQDILAEIKSFLQTSIQIALDAGIRPTQLMIDPGIGFGKTPEQNIHVMGRLDELHELGLPILLGTSRKSMIGKILDLPSDQRLEGTISTNVLGIAQGVEIIRVHDVKAHLRAVKVTDAIVRRG